MPARAGHWKLVSKSCFRLPEFLKLYSTSKTAQAPLRNPGVPTPCCAIRSPSPGLFPLPKGQREAPGAGGPLSPCLPSDPSPLGLTQAPGHKETTTSPKTGKKSFNKYKNLQ